MILAFRFYMLWFSKLFWHVFAIRSLAACQQKKSMNLLKDPPQAPLLTIWIVSQRILLPRISNQSKDSTNKHWIFWGYFIYSFASMFSFFKFYISQNVLSFFIFLNKDYLYKLIFFYFYFIFSVLYFLFCLCIHFYFDFCLFYLPFLYVFWFFLISAEIP